MNNDKVFLNRETNRFEKREVAMVIKNNQVEAEEGEEELTGPEPGSEADKIDKFLDQGYSAKQLRGMGFASSTIRRRLKRRAKAKGLPAPDNGGNGKPEVALTVKEKETVLPEWLEQQVGELYDGDEKTRKIFMAGMSIPLLGMRLFSESFKPMLALMQAHTASQAEVAKSMQGGSEEVAKSTIVEAMPYLERIVRENAIATSQNPMEAMMVRAVEPIFSNVISSVMGKMFKPPGQQPQGQQGQGQGLPPGWESK